jgi:hypothetical protein
MNERSSRVVMHKIEVDHSKKIIRVTVVSFLKPESAETLIRDIFAEIRTLRGQHFCMLLDFREAAVLPPEVADMWVKLARRARIMGLKKSARLITSASMKAQVNWVGREAQNKDVVENFDNETEALSWLEQ